MIAALRDKTYRNYGALADCIAALTGAESVEARVACLRVAETVNLIHGALTKKKPRRGPVTTNG